MGWGDRFFESVYGKKSSDPTLTYEDLLKGDKDPRYTAMQDQLGESFQKNLAYSMADLRRRGLRGTTIAPSLRLASTRAQEVAKNQNLANMYATDQQLKMQREQMNQSALSSIWGTVGQGLLGLATGGLSYAFTPSLTSAVSGASPTYNTNNALGMYGNLYNTSKWYG